MHVANVTLIEQAVFPNKRSASSEEEEERPEVKSDETPVSVCLSSSNSNKISSLSSASSSSISSGHTKNEVNNNNHSINLNSKCFKQIKPLKMETNEEASTKTVGDVIGKAVEITWSVSSIRKQFEEFSDQSSDHSKSSHTHGSVVKINRHNVMQHPQSHQSNVNINSNVPRHSTSSFSSVSSNGASKCYNYHDSNGNPITYI